jgi:hypothetical protein
MLSLLLIASTVALGTANDDLPPTYFQGNAPPSVVITVDNTNTKENCGVAQKGWRILACEFTGKNNTPIIIMPNPCRYPEAKDENSYAHLMCHEFGHANGWNSDHDN